MIKWTYLLTTQVHNLQTGVPLIGVIQVPITRAHRQTIKVGLSSIRMASSQKFGKN
ncbi:MAG: hypothetical protein MRJ67_01750 [Nitrospirales bacterium]|nr:hypothetical protein [Nitrospirales bacterium]